MLLSLTVSVELCLIPFCWCSLYYQPFMFIKLLNKLLYFTSVQIESPAAPSKAPFGVGPGFQKGFLEKYPLANFVLPQFPSSLFLLTTCVCISLCIFYLSSTPKTRLIGENQNDTFDQLLLIKHLLYWKNGMLFEIGKSIQILTPY